MNLVPGPGRCARPLLLLALLAAATVLGPGPLAPARAGAAVVADHAWARPAPQGAMTAAYMTLTNTGDEDDTLLSASTDICRAAEVHTTEMQGGVMRMSPAGPLIVPAGGSVTFQPGGLHMMLIDLTQDLADGAQFTVTLQFEKAGAIPVPVTISASGG